MKILFVNPNRYHHPPVIPLGLEYLMGALAKSRHLAAALDLCFVDDPGFELQTAINDHAPDVIGITIRQIDSVLYQNNEFFLEDIKRYTAVCRQAGVPVLLGGSGFSIMPREIIAFTGADYGIMGPGESAIVDLLDMLDAGKHPDRIINGYETLPQHNYPFHRVQAVDYHPYLGAGGIIGFRTQIGCTGRCFFCIEGRKRLIFHDPLQVADDIRNLKECGYTHFHLCDSEFNASIDHSTAVCRAIVEKVETIAWTLYMKPEPFNSALFSWLKRSGATMITLSMDTRSQTQETYPRLELFFACAKKENIEVMVDLSIGFPYETESQVRKMIDFLESQPVRSVGVTSYYRVYPGTPLYQEILRDTHLKHGLISLQSSTNILYPTFFCHFDEQDVRALLGERSKFRIEGLEKATNYQRVGSETSMARREHKNSNT